MQTDLSCGRTQAVGASVPSDSGLQEPSEGSRCQRGHQAGLHGRESQHSCWGEDPGREEWVKCLIYLRLFCHLFLFLSSFILCLFLSAESKNSDSHPRSEDFILSSDAVTTKTYPPFSSLMLIHIKGLKRLGLCVCLNDVFRCLLTTACADRQAACPGASGGALSAVAEQWRLLPAGHTGALHLVERRVCQRTGESQGINQTVTCCLHKIICSYIKSWRLFSIEIYNGNDTVII